VNDLDFFADLMATGTVLGVDHTSDRAAVEAALGRERASGRSRSWMVWDYGLVEFGWHRTDAWAVTYYGAQTHRLPWLAREGSVEAALVDRYGAFRPTLPVDEVRAALRVRGFALEPRPALDDDVEEYWEPTSRMGIVVEAGVVLKMLGPSTRGRGSPGAFGDYARHLLTLSDAERVAWLSKREPGTEPERTDWWYYLRIAVARRAEGGSARSSAWRRLEIALDSLAVRLGVDAEDEGAAALCSAVVGGGGDGLPTPDEAVARWLAAVPVSLDEARRLCVDRPLEPAEVRLSRRLRDQIHTVQPCLDVLTASTVASELRAWTSLKPELLRRPLMPG
jgi:hypothetical protein